MATDRFLIDRIEDGIAEAWVEYDVDTIEAIRLWYRNVRPPQVLVFDVVGTGHRRTIVKLSPTPNVPGLLIPIPLPKGRFILEKLIGVIGIPRTTILRMRLE